MINPRKKLLKLNSLQESFIYFIIPMDEEFSWKFEDIYSQRQEWSSDVKWWVTVFCDKIPWDFHGHVLTRLEKLNQKGLIYQTNLSFQDILINNIKTILSKMSSCPNIIRNWHYHFSSHVASEVSIWSLQTSCWKLSRMVSFTIGIIGVLCCCRKFFDPHSSATC